MVAAETREEGRLISKVVTGVIKKLDVEVRWKEGGELWFSVVFLGQVGTIVLGFEKKYKENFECGFKYL